MLDRLGVAAPQRAVPAGFDLVGPDVLGVHLEAGRVRLVPQNRHRLEQVADCEIDAAVVVEISQDHAASNVGAAEVRPPTRAVVGESAFVITKQDRFLGARQVGRVRRQRALPRAGTNDQEQYHEQRPPTKVPSA